MLKQKNVFSKKKKMIGRKTTDISTIKYGNQKLSDAFSERNQLIQNRHIKWKPSWFIEKWWPKILPRKAKYKTSKMNKNNQKLKKKASTQIGSKNV